MNRREYLKGLAAVGCGAVLSAGGLRADEAKEPIRLRVVSYNIQIGRAPGGSYSDPKEAFLDRTASRLNDMKPDVAGLQEVDNKTNRSGADVDQLGYLAEKTGLIGTFAPKTPLPGGMYGVGVLSKEKPIAARAVIMKGSSHPRALQICEFERYVFFNTHFPLVAELRLAAAKTVEAEALKYDKPIILVGDLNAEPDSEEILELKKTWTQVSPERPTFPAPEPTVQIDYVFVRNVAKVTTLEARVVEDPSTSDHRPVLCSIEME